MDKHDKIAIGLMYCSPLFTGMAWLIAKWIAE